MTAFGRASRVGKAGHFSVELQSVNRKGLDLVIALPPELHAFEVEVRRWVGTRVVRGRIQVTVRLSLDGKQSGVRAVAHLPLARQLGEAWARVAREAGVAEPAKLVIAALARADQLVALEADPEAEASFLEDLKPVVEAALDHLALMKRREGEALQMDIIERLRQIGSMIEQIAGLGGQAAESLQKKLRERIEAVLPGRLENEERLLREVALYAERADISEELTRLRSHVEQFQTLLGSDEVGVGRTLDFLVQELLREMTTVLSKSEHVGVTRLAIAGKAELEKVREQIQNVE